MNQSSRHVLDLFALALAFSAAGCAKDETASTDPKPSAASAANPTAPNEGQVSSATNAGAVSEPSTKSIAPSAPTLRLKLPKEELAKYSPSQRKLLALQPELKEHMDAMKAEANKLAERRGVELKNWHDAIEGKLSSGTGQRDENSTRAKSSQ